MKRNVGIVWCLILILGMAARGHARDDDDSICLGDEPMPIGEGPGDITPLGVGDDMPFGAMKTPVGNTEDFESFVRRKPTVLAIGQGVWSAFTRAQIHQLALLRPQLQEWGYQAAALLPDQPAKLETESRGALADLPLFSDVRMEITRRFGLAYRVDEKALQLEHVRLSDYTGDDLDLLPEPALYAIDVNGTIRYVRVYRPGQPLMDTEKLLASIKNAFAR